MYVVVVSMRVVVGVIINICVDVAVVAIVHVVDVEVIDVAVVDYVVVDCVIDHCDIVVVNDFADDAIFD